MPTNNKERLAWVVLLVASVMQFHGGFSTPLIGKHELKVLVMERTDRQYNAAQGEAILSAKTGKTNEWLNSNCTVVDGNPERRVWDTNTDVTGESDFWKEAKNHNHGAVFPEVETFNGRKWSAPQPITSEAQLQGILSSKKGSEEDATSQ